MKIKKIINDETKNILNKLKRKIDQKDFNEFIKYEFYHGDLKQDIIFNAVNFSKKQNYKYYNTIYTKRVKKEIIKYLKTEILCYFSCNFPKYDQKNINL